MASKVALPPGGVDGAAQTSGHEAFDIVLDHILVWLQDVGQIFKCQVTADFLHTCRGGIFNVCCREGILECFRAYRARFSAWKNATLVQCEFSWLPFAPVFRRCRCSVALDAKQNTGA